LFQEENSFLSRCEGFSARSLSENSGCITENFSCAPELLGRTSPRAKKIYKEQIALEMRKK